MTFVRTDPSDTGGLFIRRRPGTAPTRYAALPDQGTTRRRLFDEGVAAVVAGLMIVVNLCFWGPLPLGWLWVGSHVDYWTGSISLGILVAFVGLLLTLMAALGVLKRLDHFWILARRAAGHDQRTGIIGPIFAITAAIGATLFFLWLIFIGGLGPDLAPRSQ